MHSRTYVHMDIKGANILMGIGKGATDNFYLVDFGLACHNTTKEFKPNPKTAHNGTIEYTSRDAHLGVPTMRGDLEVLGYNMLHWLGQELPWETENLLNNPKKVQERKEQFMAHLDKHMAKSPESVKSFMKYVAGMAYDETPDYRKCEDYFEKGLKMAVKDAAVKPGSSRNQLTPKSPRKRARADSVEAVPTPEAKLSPQKRATPGKKRVQVTPSPIIIDDSPLPSAEVPPSSDLQRAAKGRKGNLVINNEITPKSTKKMKKTYEFNFELDVSVDANVVVNVKRKKKATADKALTPVSSSNDGSSSKKQKPAAVNGTPISPVRKRIARTVKVTPSGTVRVERG